MNVSSKSILERQDRRGKGAEPPLWRPPHGENRDGVSLFFRRQNAPAQAKTLWDVGPSRLGVLLSDLAVLRPPRGASSCYGPETRGIGPHAHVLGLQYLLGGQVMPPLQQVGGGGGGGAPFQPMFAGAMLATAT
jgi:hypothetical protein